MTCFERNRAIQLFCLLVFCYSFVHQRSDWNAGSQAGWNQNSRLDLLHALFVHRTLRIDAYHENTGDKSVHDGHYYSDKAPGIVFLTLPAFALSTAILKITDIPLDSPRGWLVSSWISTAGSVGLVTALGMVALFLLLCRFVNQEYAFTTTLIVSLGAAPFPYATMLFSHAAVMALISIALYSIADDFAPRLSGGDTDKAPQIQHSHVKRHILAGFCCGLAIASEYTAAVAAAGVLALAIRHGLKNGMIIACAALLPLSLIPAYNWICFGGPFAFGYHNLVLDEFQEMNKGLFGIGFPPKPSAIYLILFSPERGLFFWTPFFLMAPVGLFRLLRTAPKIFWISLIAILAQIILISGYFMPGGGAALGPRHLASILPFIAIAAAMQLQDTPRLGHHLGFYSLLFTGLGTLVNAMPPISYVDPLFDYFLPKLIKCEITYNLGDYLGLRRCIGAIGLILFIIAFFFLVIRKSERRIFGLKKKG
jgi:hypothetical protein